MFFLNVKYDQEHRYVSMRNRLRTWSLPIFTLALKLQTLIELTGLVDKIKIIPDVYSVKRKWMVKELLRWRLWSSVQSASVLVEDFDGC